MPKIRAVVVPVVVFGGLIGSLVYSQRGHGPLKVSGFVEAHQIRVGSRIGGRVHRVAVEEGQIVNVTSPIDHEVTLGNLCIKGRFGWSFVSSGRSDG